MRYSCFFQKYVLIKEIFTNYYACFIKISTEKTPKSIKNKLLFIVQRIYFYIIFTEFLKIIMQVNIKGIPYKNGKLDKLGFVKPQIHI